MRLPGRLRSDDGVQDDSQDRRIKENDAVDENRPPLYFIGYVNVTHGVGQAYGKGNGEKIFVGGLACFRKGKAPAQKLTGGLTPESPFSDDSP